MASPTPLQAVRKQLGYSAEQVVRLLVERAHARNLPVASASSLKTQLSRWENGRPVEDVMYQRLFCEIYGRTPGELGFPDEDVDPDAEELRARLTVARRVDDESVRLFFDQLDMSRRADRRFGGMTQLDQVRAHAAHAERLLRSGAPGTLRSALARALAEASALAGWLSLDRVALRPAWDHHETAIVAAREAGSTAHLAHAMAQQAVVAVDLDMIDVALDRVTEARRIAGDHVSPLMLAWLAATEGEIRAAASQRDAALRAFDDADAFLPADPQDPELSFLYLAGGHLERWRGHGLARIGEPEAIAHLDNVLATHPADFVRARASTLTDLAYAHAAAGARDAALDAARQARRIASEVSSDRQRRRLDALQLPL